MYMVNFSFLKDTVSARKKSSSSEEFCHYTSHRPNIHWNTGKQDTHNGIYSFKKKKKNSRWCN